MPISLNGDGIISGVSTLTTGEFIVTQLISAPTATFSGNVSVGGTITYEDVTNVDSIGLITARSGLRISNGGIVVSEGITTVTTLNAGITTVTTLNAGIATITTLIPQETRFLSVSEKLTRVDGNSVNLVYNSNGSNIGFATNPSGDISVSINGIPTSSDFDDHIITFTIFVNQVGTARSCTSISLNGVNKVINWAGGSIQNALIGVSTSNGYDIYSFTGINTVGSASTTENYTIIGSVNGGYGVY